MDWHLEALFSSEYVDEVHLIGLRPDEYPSTDQLIFIPYDLTSTIFEKITTGAKFLQEKYPEQEHLIISTGDAPGILTESIDTVIETLQKDQEIDVLLGGTPEWCIKEVFPEHGRVFGKFSDQSVTPGEMMALRYSIIPKLEDEIEQSTIRRRKFNRRAYTTKLIPVMRYLAKITRLWSMIGKYLSGNLSLSELEDALSTVYDMKLRAAIINDPGFEMDMDLPEDYQKLTEYVQQIKILKKLSYPPLFTCRHL